MRYSIEEATLSALGDVVREKTGKHTRQEYAPITEYWNGTAAPNAGKYQHYTTPQCYEEISSFKLILVSEEGPRPVFRYQSTEFEFDENNEAVVPAISSYDYWMTNLYVVNTDNPETYSWDIEIYYVRSDGSLVSDIQDVMNTMSPNQMIDELNEICPVPADALHITGNCEQRFRGNGWNWFIDAFGDKITTSNINAVDDMFSMSGELTEIPFAINCADNLITLYSLFANCNKLEHIEPFGYVNVGGLPYAFTGCHRLTTEEIENVFANASFDKVHQEMTWNDQAGELNEAFSGCYSMRRLPMNLIRNLANPMSNPWASICNAGFRDCWTLDEAVDIPVADQAEWWDDILYNMLGNNYRLKEFTFETNDDGTAKTAKWAYQNLKINEYVGYSFNSWRCAEQNTNITENDRVSSINDYNEKKNSENWYTMNSEFSRYNHDSAVNTINSLPDCSAFIEEMGEGTNTIQFSRYAGEKTDGGAIGNLTEEEIAVAAAKGWTVSF